MKIHKKLLIISILGLSMATPSQSLCGTTGTMGYLAGILFCAGNLNGPNSSPNTKIALSILSAAACAEIVPSSSNDGVKKNENPCLLGLKFTLSAAAGATVFTLLHKAVSAVARTTVFNQAATKLSRLM